MRTFSLNDPEAYEAICKRRAPADRNPRGAAPVKVMSIAGMPGCMPKRAILMDSPFERGTLAEAQTAFEEWQAQVEKGRMA